LAVRYGRPGPGSRPVGASASTSAALCPDFTARHRLRAAPWSQPGLRRRQQDGVVGRAGVRQAATDTGAGGVNFYVDSGWRSPAYQYTIAHRFDYIGEWAARPRATLISAPG
jgi:hypothetical protein